MRGGAACQGSWGGHLSRRWPCGWRPGRCPKRREAGSGLLVVGVGPSLARPVISLPDFGGLGANIITLGFSPLQRPCSACRGGVTGCCLAWVSTAARWVAASPGLPRRCDGWLPRPASHDGAAVATSPAFQRQRASRWTAALPNLPRLRQ
jgi:hypothetical protein